MEQINHPNEHKSAFDVVGPRDAFPIVLVHGVSWTRKMWLPQLKALSDEFRVIALDLPGHGALRKQQFQLKAAVQAVMESLKQQTHDRALIVGLSLGGYVAMACAYDHPQEIAGLALSGCCIDYHGPIGMLSWLDSYACHDSIFGKKTQPHARKNTSEHVSRRFSRASARSRILVESSATSLSRTGISRLP